MLWTWKKVNNFYILYSKFKQGSLLWVWDPEESKYSIGSRMVRGRRPRNMKYKAPRMAAIFFITSFNRDRGALAPMPSPWIRSWSRGINAAPSHLLPKQEVKDLWHIWAIYLSTPRSPHVIYLSFWLAQTDHMTLRWGDQGVPSLQWAGSPLPWGEPSWSTLNSELLIGLDRLHNFKMRGPGVTSREGTKGSPHRSGPLIYSLF